MVVPAVIPKSGSVETTVVNRNGALRTRAEKVAAIRDVRAAYPYLKDWQRAALLGMTISAYRSLLYDPDGSKQAERRKRYQGSCIDCGRPTDGSGGYAGAAERCAGCRRAFQRSPEYGESLQKWTRELIIERIQEWAAIHGKAPTTLDFRSSGNWPVFTTVINRFGTWAAALEAAGVVRTYSCVRCGKTLRYGGHGAPPVYCRPCRPVAAAERRRAYYEANRRP